MLALGLLNAVEEEAIRAEIANLEDASADLNRRLDLVG